VQWRWLMPESSHPVYCKIASLIRLQRWIRMDEGTKKVFGLCKRGKIKCICRYWARKVLMINLRRYSPNMYDLRELRSVDRPWFNGVKKEQINANLPSQGMKRNALTKMSRARVTSWPVGIKEGFFIVFLWMLL
jgi:hypothetical protein